MKRFYCTICKRMKRVRKYPVIIENTQSLNPVQRIGACNIHAGIRTVQTTTARKVAR